MYFHLSASRNLYSFAISSILRGLGMLHYGDFSNFVFIYTLSVTHFLHRFNSFKPKIKIWQEHFIRFNQHNPFLLSRHY